MKGDCLIIIDIIAWLTDGADARNTSVNIEYKKTELLSILAGKYCLFYVLKGWIDWLALRMADVNN